MDLGEPLMRMMLEVLESSDDAALAACRYETGVPLMLIMPLVPSRGMQRVRH